MSELKIFVINLAGSAKRKEWVSASLKALDCQFEFFNAIDGRENSHPLFDHYDDNVRKKYRRRKLSGGELGCWASHFLLWEKCVELNQPIIVMEDDVEISPNFRKSLEVASSIIKEVGYLRLSAIYDRPVKFVRNIDGHQLIRYLRGPAGTQCYVINPLTAKKYLKGAAIWYLAVDEYMDRPWRHGVDTYALKPYSVEHSVQDSDIVRLEKKNIPIFLKLKYEFVKIIEVLLRTKYNFKRNSEIAKLAKRVKS